ncbi:MAG: extracellular solute-binding protein [Chloroflexi bacterium]|nr:extracellular solute-binding protein [Chloroflexota bacterium]
MRNLFTPAVSVFFILALVSPACTVPAATAPPPAAPAGKAAPASSAKALWEQDWERTLAEAKKEGTVLVYTGFGADFRAALSQAVKEKYGLDAEFVLGRSAEIAERIMREQRSRAYAADVVIIGSSQHQMALWPANVLLPLKPVITLPEVLDPKMWWEGTVPWVDREAATVLQMYAFVQPPIAVNTTMVKAGEIKSWRDLRKWQGQMIMDDPTLGSGPAIQQLALVGEYIMGWDFVRELAGWQPLLLRDRNQQLQWLAMGKNPVLLFPETASLSPFKKTGAPVGLVTPAEGATVTAGFGTVAMLKGAPHPNAAKVFINFLLTKEGQTVATRTTLSQSARLDVPVDHLDPDLVRIPGIKYASSTDEKFMAVQVDLYNRLIDIFKPLVK